MAIRLRPLLIDRFPPARKAFAVLALCATVLVPMELLGTASGFTKSGSRGRRLGLRVLPSRRVQRC